MMNVMEAIFEIRSCMEILANDIKIDTTDRICSAVNKKITIKVYILEYSSLKRYEWGLEWKGRRKEKERRGQD